MFSKLSDKLSVSFPIFLGTRLEIPASVSAIYSDAFKSCPNLTEIIFHEGLEEIGEGSFEGCNSLKNIVFPESLWALDYAFSDITLDYIEIGRKNIAFDANIRVPDCKNLTIRKSRFAEILSCAGIYRRGSGKPTEHGWTGSRTLL